MCRWNIFKRPERGYKFFGRVSDRFSDPFLRFSNRFSYRFLKFFGGSFVLQTCRPNTLYLFHVPTRRGIFQGSSDSFADKNCARWFLPCGPKAHQPVSPNCCCPVRSANCWVVVRSSFCKPNQRKLTLLSIILRWVKGFPKNERAHRLVREAILSVFVPANKREGTHLLTNTEIVNWQQSEVQGMRAFPHDVVEVGTPQGLQTFQKEVWNHVLQPPQPQGITILYQK